MRLSIVLLLLIALMISCKKKPLVEPTPAPTKWEQVLGHYKVYDSTGVFIYEMDIDHSIGATSQGYRVDSLIFLNFDGQFDFHVAQNSGSEQNSDIFSGIYEAVSDSIDNHWNIYCLGSYDGYNSFRNDSIVFYFQKQNMPYWWNDGTTYFNKNLKQIAVKQH